MKVPYSKRIDHSHKKKYSLKTCAWLLFLLLQYFFASARRHTVHKKNLLPMTAVHFSYYLKLSNIIAQRKTTDNSFIHDWFHLFKSKFSCTEIDNTCKWQAFTIHTVHLLQTDWKSYHARNKLVTLLVTRNHQNIHELASLTYS